jgi:4-hydroxybenzoate polyprenyltransferase
MSANSIDEAATRPDSESFIALVIDLDGTLLHTDLFYESYFNSLSNGFQYFWSFCQAFFRGKAPLKAALAGASQIKYELLSYNDDVLALINDARAKGRSVYLATASDVTHAEAVAAKLGVFDGVFASDGVINLRGDKKAEKLTEAFGAGGFDYVGNGFVDLAVWSRARKAYVVGASSRLRRKMQRLGIPVEHLKRESTPFRAWFQALRVHQYAKNALVFVPLLTSHSYSLQSFTRAGLAFLAFSLCASAGYILNDLVDLEADRQHPTKHSRPFANSTIPISHGMIAIPLLLVAAFTIAWLTSPMLAAVLAAYFSLTLAYSLSLKRKLLADAIALSMLYTLRVIGGSVALPVVLSEWLLAFSVFIFTSLALIKRYIELAVRLDNVLPNPTNRNYRIADLPVMGALAAASGFNAVTVLAFYISSPAVTELYRRPALLWLICPILLYWIGRTLVLAHRRELEDDPILFALRDRVSHACGILMIAIVLLAS